MITLLKKGGRHVWEDLDDYRPITLLNTELKILAQVLANCSLLSAIWLNGTELRCKGKIDPRQLASGSWDPRGVKRRYWSCADQFRSVQGLRQGRPSVLSDGFGDHRIRTGVPQMDQHVVPQPAGNGAGERKAFEGVRDRQGWPLSPLLYVITLEALLRRLKDEKDNPALRVVPFTGRVRAKVSVYADDITVFVSRHLDILAVKKSIERYAEVADAKINFDKSEGLWLNAWRCGVPLTELFRWSDGPVRILEVLFRHGFQLERNWPAIETRVGIWLRRRLFLKGRAEVCYVYIFPLILIHLSVLPLPRGHRVVLKQSLSKLLWKGRSPVARRQVCYQLPRSRGLGVPDLESHWFAERLACLGRYLSRDMVWGQKVRVVFPRPKSNPEIEGRRRLRDEALFVCDCCMALRIFPGSSDLSRPRKELYQELVVGSASDPLVERFGWSLG